MTATPHDPVAQPAAVALPMAGHATWRGHLRIMRVDHWFKNVFVLPGVVIALAAQDSVDWGEFAWRFVVGMLAVCIVASSNYVINEVLDAPYDLEHPVKRHRPVPTGLVNVRLAYVQWVALMVAGVGLGAVVSPWVALTLLGLWIAGCVYNIPPRGRRTCRTSTCSPRRSTTRCAYSWAGTSLRPRRHRRCRSSSRTG
jgi:4-hydroxybenzoate polyprenyltransferase